MRVRTLRRLAPFLVALAVACDSGGPPTGPADPCDAPGACEVAGVDLVVVSAGLAWSDTAHYDPVSKLHYASLPDSIPIEYRVQNRGDRASPAASLVLNACWKCASDQRVAPLGALAPGEVAQAVVSVHAGGPAVDSIIRAVVQINPTDAPDDPVYADNIAVTEPYAWAVPRLQGALMVLDPEIRAGESARLEVRLQNLSRLGALSDTIATLCTDNVGCWGAAPSSGHFRIAALAPGVMRTDTATLDVPVAWNGYAPYARWDGKVVLCLVQRVYFHDCTPISEHITVLPDIEAACHPPLLAPATPTTVSRETAVCSRLANGTSMVWSFDAVAGRRYTAVAVGDTADVAFSVWDHDGTRVGDAASAAVPSSGRYYLVATTPDWRARSYTLTLLER